MFESLKPKGQENSRPSEANNSSINLIGSGTVIEGEVRATGDIRVDGTIKGSVYSKAKIVVGSTGLIEGDVVCQNADITGTVKGHTTVTELLFLKAASKINGDIVTGKLVVEVGASFTGNCNMGPLIKDIKYGEPATESKLKEKAAS